MEIDSQREKYYETHHTKNTSGNEGQAGLRCPGESAGSVHEPL
jgi:hypothetical protein